MVAGGGISREEGATLAGVMALLRGVTAAIPMGLTADSAVVLDLVDSRYSARLGMVLVTGMGLLVGVEGSCNLP